MSLKSVKLGSVQFRSIQFARLVQDLSQRQQQITSLRSCQQFSAGVIKIDYRSTATAWRSVSLALKIFFQQDNVHTNTESVQCISIVYSICPYKYNQ